MWGTGQERGEALLALSSNLSSQVFSPELTGSQHSLLSRYPTPASRVGSVLGFHGCFLVPL